MYEFTDELAASILKALSQNFSDYVIYTTDGANILLIAINEGELPAPDWSAVFRGDMADELARIDVNSESDMLVRKLIERDALVPYLKRSPIPVNSDYFPYVDQHSAKARYKGSQSELFVSLTNPPLPVVEMLAGDELRHTELTSVPFLWRVQRHESARWIYRRLAESASFEELAGTGRGVRPYVKHRTELLRSEIQSCVFDGDATKFRFSVHDIMAATLPLLDTDEGLALIDAVANASCAAQQEEQTQMLLDLYRAVARRDGESMAAASARLLEDDAGIPAVLHSYILSAGMLGDIAAGRPDAARNVWERHAGQVFADRELPTHVELISSIALDTDTGAPRLSDAR